MGKRPRSLDENICRQFKIHVSEKEVNTGAMKDHNMKQVCCSTVSRLFKGINMWYKSMDPNKLTDQNGILTVKNNTVDVLCVCGHYSKNDNARKCSYCEKFVCFTCLRECNLCKYLFCKNCSVEVYDSNFENWICLSCLT